MLKIKKYEKTGVFARFFCFSLFFLCIFQKMFCMFFCKSDAFLMGVIHHVCAVRARAEKVKTKVTGCDERTLGVAVRIIGDAGWKESIFAQFHNHWMARPRPNLRFCGVVSGGNLSERLGACEVGWLDVKMILPAGANSHKT